MSALWDTEFRLCVLDTKPRKGREHDVSEILTTDESEHGSDGECVNVAGRATELS